MKVCPFCAEDIRDAAVVCKYCGRDLTARPVSRTRRYRLLAFSAVIALIVATAPFVAARMRAPKWARNPHDYNGKCVLHVRAAIATPDGPIEDALNRYVPDRTFQPTTDGLALRLIGAPNDASDVDVTISGVDMTTNDRQATGAYRHEINQIPRNILTVQRLDQFTNATGEHWSPKTMRVDEVAVRMWSGGEVCTGDTTPTASVSEIVSGR